eukprot:SAG31_NODE_27558_length_424_cov_0.710769_2_plen_52_part_01
MSSGSESINLTTVKVWIADLKPSFDKHAALVWAHKASPVGADGQIDMACFMS